MTAQRVSSDDETIPAADLPPGAVKRVGNWAVGNAGGRGGDAGADSYFAVGRVCRHQFADLSKGSIDRDGCLVCPWHGSRYDVSTGRMVRGPRGFLGYRGKTPGYTQFVETYSKVLPLRRAIVERMGDVLRIRRRTR